MTLQYLLKGCPTSNYSFIEVYVEGNPVYDYKSKEQTVILLSIPFEETVDLDPINLQELVDFSKELDYPEDNITFLCEQELQELTSSTWQGTKLTLHF